MKRKRFVLMCICVAILFIIGGVYASRDTRFLNYGKQVDKISQNKTDEFVAKVNGVGISKSEFDTYKAGLSNANGTFTDEEIIDKLVQQEVIMQEIHRLGYTVTDEEVNEFNEKRFALLDGDPTAYQIVKDYVDGLGITMEEYKEMSKKVSEEALLANKYKEDLKKEFDKKSSASTYSAKDSNEKFENYFTDKVKSLKQKADIDILK